MVVRSSRVAQCSASFPSTMRNQWVCSESNVLPLGGRRPLKEWWRTGCKIASGDGWTSSECRELIEKPFHRLAHRKLTLDVARLGCAERGMRVLDVLSCHLVITHSEVALVPHLLEVTTNEVSLKADMVTS